MTRKSVFQSEGFCLFVVVLTSMSLFNPQSCNAQIEVKESGSLFQNFNSLSSSGITNHWVDNVTIPGWYWQCTANPFNTYFSDNGNTDIAGKRCYGATDDSDRAMGGLCKDDIKPFCYGIKLHNNSSKPITNISVSYTGEQWSVSSFGSNQILDFSYSVTKDVSFSFTNNVSTSWNTIPALDFVSPQKASITTIRELDGNDPANRVKINEYSIQGINVLPGQYVLLRWRDMLDGNGKEDFGLAIDDVTIKWEVMDCGAGSSAIWTGAHSTAWSDNLNWCNLKVPNIDSDVEITSTTMKPICIENINIKSLVIRNGGQLTIDPSKTITVMGNSTFDGPNCLILRSSLTPLLNYPKEHAASASFLCKGNVSGTGSIKVERYITGYKSETDGWHFYSSPLNNPILDDLFKPGLGDDFYSYLESGDTWLDQKLNFKNLNPLLNGHGYLISCAIDGVRSISGLPNNNNINFTDLSYTANRGWHLLGNPYPCGIQWDDGNWGINGISLTAKLLNSGGTYSDLSSGDIIPSMNGFFIKVNYSSNTITIPIAARLHTIATGWKSSKAAAIKKIKLIINSNTNNTFAEAKIMLNDKATTGYDLDYDSPYLSGMEGTPLFYSVLSTGEELSTNSVPEAASLSFNFEFTPGLAKEYTLKAEISEEWASTAVFILEDKLTKLKYTLNNSSLITFSSDSIDAPDRFKLMIDIVTGIEKRKNAENLSIISRDKHITIFVPDYINSGQVSVYDLLGRQIVSRKLIKGSMNFKLSNSGYYLVHVLSNKGSMIKKIYIP